MSSLYGENVVVGATTDELLNESLLSSEVCVVA